MKTESRTKDTQVQQSQAQQQKHPSVILLELQAAITQQQQPLNALLSIVSDLAEEVRDLTSLVQSLRAQQANPMVRPYEDEDPAYDEPEDGQEYAEDEDLADEEDFQDDQAYEEEGDEAISSFQEPEPAPQRRRAAQPAEPTCEGPKPFLLPDVPRARLNVRRQEGVR